MIKDRDAALQGLLDRQDIYDCMVRYCRGVDRLDADLVASAYHPDGLDDHGGYVGPRDGFVTWGQNMVRTLWDSAMHIIGNHSCELDGNAAHTETYFIHIAITKNGKREIRPGRYVQRYEKRNDVWAIADSICIMECDEPDLDMEAVAAGIGTDTYIQGRRDRQDPSYARPLKVDRKRFTTNKMENA